MEENYKNIRNGFPFSKEEFGNFCTLLDIFIFNTCKNASNQYPKSKITQIFKNYQCLKYPLLLIWEYYGFGDIDDVSIFVSNMYYQAFKVDTIDTMNQIINGISQENPFDFYGKIEGSDEMVNKLLLVYNHLLDNLKRGILIL